jgi:hypothetical protein
MDAEIASSKSGGVSMKSKTELIRTPTLSARARKTLGALFLAGGLLGGQVAQAAVPAAPANIQNRVAAVREELAKRVVEAQQLGGHDAIQKLPFAQFEVATWLNWVNWPNWNNWRDWNNWHNWSNWRNWINY